MYYENQSRSNSPEGVVNGIVHLVTDYSHGRRAKNQSRLHDTQQRTWVTVGPTIQALKYHLINTLCTKRRRPDYSQKTVDRGINDPGNTKINECGMSLNTFPE